MVVQQSCCTGRGIHREVVPNKDAVHRVCQVNKGEWCRCIAIEFNKVVRLITSFSKQMQVRQMMGTVMRSSNSVSSSR